MQKRLHIIVKGRVQMVMYRDFTQRKARALGLSGTVENLDNGSVEIFVEGDTSLLEKFTKKLYKGPVFARVDSVTISELPELKEYKGYKIIF